ncbi:MAG: hypothetical protein KF771_12275 [Burkholderiales bacterium]|nr:hypothetical protein [Burkholderiales bacterium]
MDAIKKSLARITKRKIFGVFLIFVMMTLAITALGQFWIKNSAAYEQGRIAVSTRLGVMPESVELKRLASFRFGESELDGEALFVLCGNASKCFTVVAKKRNAQWSVIDLIER